MKQGAEFGNPGTPFTGITDRSLIPSKKTDRAVRTTVSPTKMSIVRATSILAGVILVHILTGCAAHHAWPPNDNRLTTANYVVDFETSPPDPDARDGYGYYGYRILRKDSPSQVRDLTSGISRFYNTQDALGFWKKCVRLLESTDGERLLIEDDVPNDCWPLRNYIMVSQSKSGLLEHTYLKVPEAPHEGIPGPGGVPKAPDDPSKIVSLDGEIMTFRYANGKIEHRRLESIPRMSQPRLLP